jgi:hypothetical protein
VTTQKPFGRILRTAMAVAAAAAIAACASWIPTTKGIDIEDMPKRPAESIREIVKDGDIVAIDRLSVAGSDRWQVEYRDRDDKLRYVAVKEDGDKVDWVGDTPVDFDNVPKRPKDAIRERTRDGKIITVRRGQVFGKDRWTVRWRDSRGKTQEFTVGEDGEKID